MRFHILGLPHTFQVPNMVSLIYTENVFGKMMTIRGHEVIHYGHEESDLICTEHVQLQPTKT